jgi:hypothetical protein
MHPSLLVLAAGMGSRYGGLKQIDPVGPSGETVLDYAVFDAIRAGFGRVIFVIRREFEGIFREQIGAKYAGRIGVDYVFQSGEALPEGSARTFVREKPWGTGHAVWCARDAVRENFAVINADDFYGKDSFAQLGGFLTSETMGMPASGNSDERSAETSAESVSPSNALQFAIVGFRLANTLSEHGAVSRGVCVADERGALKSITERTGILPSDVGVGRTYSGDEIVSMNCWGFSPRLFPVLDERFREFLALRGDDPKAEFYLPAAVSEMIARGKANVRVLPTDASWFGVTYRDDKPRVVAALAELVNRGLYPAKLFP